MKINDSEKHHNYMDFYKILENETQRGAVVITLTFFDSQLKELIANHLANNRSSIIEVLNYPGSLRSFISKLELAWKFCLIEKESKKDLERINEIRNLFAHQIFKIDFENEEIIEKCNRLHHKLPLDHIAMTPERIFLIASAIIMQELEMKLFEQRKI